MLKYKPMLTSTTIISVPHKASESAINPFKIIIFPQYQQKIYIPIF